MGLKIPETKHTVDATKPNIPKLRWICARNLAFTKNKHGPINKASPAKTKAAQPGKEIII